VTPAAPFSDLLLPSETLLWQGRIGFNFTSSSVTVLAVFMLAAYAFWATWGTYSVAEFCPPEESAGRCGSMYWLTAPILTAIAVSQGFDALERRALSGGKAQGAILLTDRRLIRVLDWPWLRIRSHDYRASAPRRGIGGVLRFGISSVILSPQDADQVSDLMRTPGKRPA
jgi:hypothetical protein